MSVTITTSAADIKRWLSPAIKTAGTDDGLPVLTYVELRVRPDHVLAVSTDRFRASASRLALRDDDKDDDLSLTTYAYAGDLSRVLHVFRPSGRFNPALRVTFTEAGVSIVDMSGLALTVASPMIDGKGGKYPDVVSLFREAVRRMDKGEGLSSSFGVNFLMLAELRVAIPPRETTVISASGSDGKPWLVRFGDYYLGMVMPRREGDLEHPKPITDAWREALA
ncbi:hypothetical protein [Nocardioides sp.]|uniref:hypothetical protein n=1 Tax=Nocardioides sp. TaxID=35761 RepID=UPI0039E71770